VALTDYSSYKSAKPYIYAQLNKGSVTTIAGRLADSWLRAPLAGSAPSTAVVPTAATTGALFDSPSGLAAWIKKIRVANFAGASVMIYDRLSHQGGLSGTVTGAQTTNLPTAALTRYTSGVGVHAAIEIYTSIGTSATTFTCSYTNSAGVSGRTSPVATIGGTNDRLASSVIFMPLQQGDVGVRSVESVNLAGSTATAGNFGIMLYKPLAFAFIPNFRQHVEWDAVRDGGCMFENVPADACLGMMISVNTTSLGCTAGSFELIKQV